MGSFLFLKFVRTFHIFYNGCLLLQDRFLGLKQNSPAMLGTTVTQPSATRGAFLQNEARRAGVGGLPGRPGSWQSRAGTTCASKEALIVKVSKEIKGSWRERLPLGARAMMPAFTARLLPVLGVPSHLGVVAPGSSGDRAGGS